MNGITANPTLEAEFGEASEVKTIMTFKQFDSAHLGELVELSHLYIFLGEEMEGNGRKGLLAAGCWLLCGGAAGGRGEEEEEEDWFVTHLYSDMNKIDETKPENSYHQFSCSLLLCFYI